MQEVAGLEFYRRNPEGRDDERLFRVADTLLKISTAN
jgi:hypothetical protein